MKFRNEILLQYYHEQVISVEDTAKKLSDAGLIIKFASSSGGERVFRDFRSEIYILSEEKTSADEKNGRIFALKLVNFTDIDISKYFIIAASYL